MQGMAFDQPARRRRGIGAVLEGQEPREQHIDGWSGKLRPHLQHLPY
jgi:hypothetical protein